LQMPALKTAYPHHIISVISKYCGGHLIPPH
jgi:hypothetical protein